jgi:hypothetical protein
MIANAGGKSGYHQNTTEHENFYVVRQACPAPREWIITVLHEVPDGAEELGCFGGPVEAIDFAQVKVQELRASGTNVEYVDPPDDLVGLG